MQIGNRDVMIPMADPAVQTSRLMQRSLVYRLLSRVYRREPDQGFLTELGSAEILSIAGAFSPRVDTDALRITDRRRIQGLAVEFCRLFLGPGPRVPPYESVHRTEPGNSGRLWGDATVQVRRLVQSLGLHYADDFHEIPDHASVEFELMYRLLDAEGLGLHSDDTVTCDNARRIQGILFNEHLGVWLPAFCERLEAATDDSFYRAIAVLTRDFLTLEKELYATLGTGT